MTVNFNFAPLQKDDSQGQDTVATTSLKARTTPTWGQKSQQEPIPRPDPVESFLAEMAKFGLNPGPISIDGGIQRFDTEKKGDRAGWYVFHSGNISSGTFGNWKVSDKGESWCSHKKREMSEQQWEKYRADVAAAQETAAQAKAEEQRQAAIEAQKIWDHGQPADPKHPYLVKKQIGCHDLKQDGHKLLIPIMDETGKIVSLQTIHSNYFKSNQKGGKVEGCFHVIGDPDRSDTVYIAEGFATGASINEISGSAVYISFGTKNLKAITGLVKKRHPEKKIIIAADNDIEKEKETGENPGMIAAKEAAKANGVDVVFPIFKDTTTKPTDFNDLRTLEWRLLSSRQHQEANSSPKRLI